MLAFVSGQGLVVERANGSQKRLLVRSSTTCKVVCEGMTFGWAPDSRQIAVAGAGAQTNRLEIVSLAGRVTFVAPPTRWALYTVVGWAPNGRELAYTRFCEDPIRGTCNSLTLALVKLPGGAVHTLVTFHDRHDGPAAAWSPNGRWIAFTDDGRDPRDPRFATVDVATGAVQAIKGLAPYDQVPSWSPNSSQLAVGQYQRPTAVVTRSGRVVRSFSLNSVTTVWARDGRLFLLHGDNTPTVLYVSSDGRGTPRKLFQMRGGEELFGLDPGFN